jgi:serine/threonine protein kinase
MASHGRYTIRGKLADGGMAEIFLAVQHGAEGFEKPVVLKRILTQFSADPQFRNMLLDEAHISMSLQHSNIAQVLDLGVAAGRYFLVLELVDGWDLERILQRAHAAGMVWPAALALHVTACVCRALAYAHGKARDGKPLEIVHRDISPNNVFISDQGEIKLADFGIAKAQRKRDQTAAGVIKGKVAYMSPEQAIGGAVDKRSDIFSVGSMLYRMMTNRLPFQAGNDMESLLRVQKGEFEPPEKVRPTVGTSVSAIIMRAMRLAPSERFQTADEMLADVERVLRNEFHSAGQTELKLWLEQLARRDSVPPVSKHRFDTAGVIGDVLETDLSVGTSFELDDLDNASAQTDDVLAAAATISAPGGVPPTPPPAAFAGSTGRIRSPGDARGRRRSGFWPGVVFALLAVIGLRYLWTWAEPRGYLPSFNIRPPAAPQTPGQEPPPPTAGVPPAAPAPKPESPTAEPAAAQPSGAVPAAKPDEQAVPGEKVAVAPGRDAALPDATAPAAEKAAEPSPGKADEPAGKPTEAAAGPGDKKQEAEEPDEDALLRDAVPNAETAVIGEDEAETAGHPAVKSGKIRGGSRAAKVDTAVLHLTSAPGGAIVKTKARVLGRTPINLHFKSGNTYEIVFVKRGYQPTTRRVAVAGTKDRKIAVKLKKRAASKRSSFFHPHR